MSLGKTLTNLRRAANLTQGELGERLNVSAQAVSKWENDISEPDIATLKRLAAIYGISVSEIVDPTAGRGREGDVSGDSTLYAGKYDVYLTSLKEGCAIVFTRYYEHIFDIGELPAYIFNKSSKEIEGILPFPLTGKVDLQTAEKIKALFEEIGATVAIEPSKGQIRHLRVKNLGAPGESRILHRRFVAANVTAAVAAALLLILYVIFIPIQGALAITIMIILPICGYCEVFLLWYPTFMRAAIVGALPEAFSDSGFLMTLLSPLLFVLFIILLLPVAPINYLIAIKERIRRLRNEDRRDDIFSNKYDGLETF